MKTKRLKKTKLTLDTLIAVGSGNEHNHVELFTLSNSIWQIGKDYPYSTNIFLYSILAFEKQFIIFGGERKASTKESTIARFHPVENIWTYLGKLNVARSGHGVIQVDNEFIIVGGERDSKEDEPTESCKFSGNSMTCTIRRPYLSNFSRYPELMLIP